MPTFLRHTRRPAADGPLALVLALALPLGAAGCFNDWHNPRAQAGTDRLALVVEPARTDVEGTHFLLDSATGALWRLDAADGHQGHWVRVADGPADLPALPPAQPAKDAKQD